MSWILGDSIRVCCPRGHFIAAVDIIDGGAIVPRGIRHGLAFGYAPDLGISCIRVRCSRCAYDGSMDYLALCAELTAAAESLCRRYRMTV